MQLTEREKEVLLETIHTYTSNNRGYDEDKSMCVYETEDGKQCAVGRCMTQNGLAFGKHLVDSGKPSAVARVHERSHSGIDTYLKPEYQGLRIEFWEALQTLHDSSHNWDEKGLSKLGKERAESLFDVMLSSDETDSSRKFILVNQ